MGWSHMQGTAGSNGQLCLQTSDELIEIYRQTGLPQDFEQIVRRFSAMVLSESRRVTGDSHDAEDASQLAFLALAIEIRSGTNIRRVGPWLQRVAKRKAMKIVRSRGRRRRREDAARRSELHTLDLGSAMDSSFAAGLIRDAIDQLPERYRLPVILHYFGGMSLELIAAELKVSKQAVGTRLHRARKMLGGGLRKHGLHLTDVKLGLAIAALVPAAVVERVMRSAAPMRIPAAALALPNSVGQTLGVVSFLGTPRLVRLAVVVAAALACGGTATAWVGGYLPSLRDIRPGDALRWLERLLPSSRPQFGARLDDVIDLPNP